MKLYYEPEDDYTPATYENTRTTGFIENWQHALHLFMIEDLPIISPLIPSDIETDRRNKLLKYQKDGTIPPNIAAWYDDDEEGLAYYARNTLGLQDVLTREEYEKRKKEEYSHWREMANTSFNQAGITGKLGQFAGSLHAFAIDPLYASSFLTGYGSATTALQAMVRVGAIEGAIETAATIPKMQWHEEIGADHSGAEYLTNILFSAAAPALMAGAGKKIGDILSPRDLKVKDVLDNVKKLSKKDKRLEGVHNTLKHSDPEEKVDDVFRRDEGIDLEVNEPAVPEKYRDPYEFDKVAQEMKESDFEASAETTFYERVAPEKSFEEEFAEYQKFASKSEGQRDVQVGRKKPAPEKTETLKSVPDKEFEDFARFQGYSQEERDLLVKYRSQKEGARYLAPEDKAVLDLDAKITALENC